ncbi:MAG: hypothetical protein ACYCY7_12315 [Gallionella sp.]
MSNAIKQQTVTIDTSIIHAALAVIANEVKQSSRTKDAFCLTHPDCHAGFASAALRSQLKPCCNGEAFPVRRIRQSNVPGFHFSLPHSERCATVVKY